MIIDSHCHAWNHWPYQPAVPDPATRGSIEQLVYEMETNSVDQSFIVCAQIEHNPTNNAYIAGAIQNYPGRLQMLADLDSEWSETYHHPGMAQRLRAMAENWNICGFTHYIRRDEDGSWLTGVDGDAVFQAAEDLGMIASLCCYPHQQPAIRRIAARHPSVPILCHHLGLVQHGAGTFGENLEQVLISADQPNIFIKVSGFGYMASQKWEYPYPGSQAIFEKIFREYGAKRLCWGSDYPVVCYYMTYRQSLEVLKTHCSFVSAEDKDWILGKTLQNLMKS